MTFVGRTTLEVGSETGHVLVKVARGTINFPEMLPGSRVRALGVCTGERGVDGRMVESLLATNMNDITILQLPEETWQRYPLGTISTLTQTNSSERIIRLHGKVQPVPPGRSFLLADATGQVTLGSRPVPPEIVGTDVEVLGVLQQRGSNKVFQCGIFRSFAVATNEVSLPTLTTTEQVRRLKPDEAMRQYPVRLQGVITFTSRSAGNFQDANGSLFVWYFGSHARFKLGDFCEVEGVTHPGEFSPGVQCRKLTVLGKGQFPEPIRPTWEELINGSLDTRWVEIQGVALSVAQHAPKNPELGSTGDALEIGVKGGHILCVVPGKNHHLERFLDGIVRVRGVVMAYHDNDRHIIGEEINVPSEEFISLETPAPDDPFSTPAKHIKDLFVYNPNESVFRRVKITGQIIHVRDGVCYMMGGTIGMRVIPKDGTKAGVGDVVEAVGFPDIDSPFDKPLLTLRDAVVRKTGQMQLPVAIKVSPEDLPNREHDSTLVRLNSRLLTVSLYQKEQVLELQNGAQIYLARLNTAAGKIPQLRMGSLLEVTGTYAVRSDKSVPFEMLLNSPADIRVLELPSWWTAQHTLIVVSGMALVIFMGVIWIGMLHQQVGRRTIQLSTANQSLTGEIAERKRAENELVQTRSQHLVEQERTRIARDIHDELGSNLAQIRLLSEMTLSQDPHLEEAQSNAGKISAKALETTRVMDEIVWAVDPENDTLESLSNYLFSFASEYLSLAGVRFRIDAPTRIAHHVLTDQVRHQLYMAIKETLNNIVKHAHATEVWIRLRLENGSACFIIEDDGRGFEFDAGADAAPGASGLNNMQKRLNEIGGDFVLESAPNQGTRVKLTLPLEPPKFP